MRSLTSWIVTIGSDLLSGVVNTNAAWLARKLTFLGFEVRRIITIPCTEEDIADVVHNAISRDVGLLILTGGLGTSPDDRTCEFLAKALGRCYVLNPDAVRLLIEAYKPKGLQLTQTRLKQAFTPEGARPIPNAAGTAPGIMLETDGLLVIALPGTPGEMMVMFEHYVEPILRELAPRVHVVEAGLMIQGVSEAELAPIIERLHAKYPNAHIRTRPKGHEVIAPSVEVVVRVSADKPWKASQALNEVLDEITTIIKESFKNAIIIYV